MPREVEVGDAAICWDRLAWSMLPVCHVRDTLRVYYESELELLRCTGLELGSLFP
jgi:hypothetical protein